MFKRILSLFGAKPNANPPEVEPDAFFAEAVRRQQELSEELADSTEVVIAGVVSASGVSAGRTKGEEHWTLLFSLDAWRIEDGPLRTDSLTIRRRSTEQEWPKFRDSIRPETIISVRARLSEDNVFGSPQAQLEEILGPYDQDADLNHKQEEFLQPVTFQDDYFGTFTLDRRVNWYSTTASWGGMEITLHLDPDEGEISSALKVASALWQEEEAWTKRIQNYAVQELLALKNDSWLDEGESPLSASQFIEKMTLESITVCTDGEFEFWHDDGELFWGHSIQVSGSLSDGPNHADIPG